LAPHDIAPRILGAKLANRLQNFCLLRPHGLSAEAGRRLHRREREELEQMVRHHVAQCTGRIVELATRLDIQRLRGGDLDMVDVIAIPQRFENAVGKPKDKDVLNRFFAQIVIDPIDLVLREYAENIPIERERRGQIVAERLLYDDAAPMAVVLTGETGLSEPLHDGGERLCWGCEVEQVIAVSVMRCVGLGEKLRQIRVERGIVELAWSMVEPLGEPIPVGIRRVAGGGFAVAKT
jgi:hypothetical protein